MTVRSGSGRAERSPAGAADERTRCGAFNRVKATSRSSKARQQSNAARRSSESKHALRQRVEAKTHAEQRARRRAVQRARAQRPHGPSLRSVMRERGCDVCHAARLFEALRYVFTADVDALMLRHLPAPQPRRLAATLRRRAWPARKHDATCAPGNSPAGLFFARLRRLQIENGVGRGGPGNGVVGRVECNTGDSRIARRGTEQNRQASTSGVAGAAAG